jgi:hypothetical protein
MVAFNILLEEGCFLTQCRAVAAVLYEEEEQQKSRQEIL